MKTYRTNLTEKERQYSYDYCKNKLEESFYDGELLRDEIWFECREDSRIRFKFVRKISDVQLTYLNYSKKEIELHPHNRKKLFKAKIPSKYLWPISKNKVFMRLNKYPSFQKLILLDQNIPFSYYYEEFNTLLKEEVIETFKGLFENDCKYETWISRGESENLLELYVYVKHN